MKIRKEFYLQDDVVMIARKLLGKYLFTRMDNKITGGIITETEAYAGTTDKASHAYNNRRTKRTEVMFAEGGVAYVYLCYGMYPLFNIVTNKKDIPDAVLIRGIFPAEGTATMLKRIKKDKLTADSLNGPGKAAMALGINCTHSSADLTKSIIWLEDRGIKVRKNDIFITKRIGVDYAGEDALLPYRFILKESFFADKDQFCL